MSKTLKHKRYKKIKVKVDSLAILKYEMADNEFNNASQKASVHLTLTLAFLAIAISLFAIIIDKIDNQTITLIFFDVISFFISLISFILYFVYSRKSKKFLDERKKYEVEKFLWMNRLDKSTEL